MNRLRIIHISQALGGVETSIRNIIENVDDSRIESILITPSRTLTISSSSGKTVEHYRVPFVRSINLILDCYSLLKLLLLLKRLKPDIIHCHSSKAGIIGRLAGALLKVPRVFSPQGFSFLSTHNKIIQTIYILLEKIAKPWTTIFLACSESELQIGQKRIGFTRSKCALWKNNLPEREFICPIPSPYQFGYICTIGRPSYQKNTEMLIRCMKRIKRQGYGIKCILLGIGHHSPMKAAALKQIRTEDLSDVFILREWINHEEALAIIHHALLFVLPSRYEGLPFSVIEAMALGKAVVATDVPGIRDIVIDSQTGLLVPLDDDKSMAEAIARIINNHDFRKKLESGAREEYLKHYNTKERIGDLEQIYFSICNHRIDE